MGVLIRNNAVGTLSDIEVKDCDIHDVAGDLTDYRDGKESGGIVFYINVDHPEQPHPSGGLDLVKDCFSRSQTRPFASSIILRSCDYLGMRIQRKRIMLAAFIAASALIGWSAWAWATEEDFTAFKLRIRERFPNVAQLSTADLSAWLNDPKRDKPILLDVRTEKEFAVSHLRGATRVEPSAKAEKVLAQLPPGRPVVTYCSVGYRSSEFAERLKKAGVAAVYNLEGSIFQWANEGRPIEADGQPANKVHPYDRKFGKMLDEKKRANP